MCWRNNVHWGIHADDDPKKFMSVTSGEYVLAIPDYSHQARETSSGMGRDTDSMSSRSSNKDGSKFKKVIMKLSGNVRWLAGLVLERNVPGGGRSFRFKPHYDVVMTTPDRAKAPPGQVSSPLPPGTVQYLTCTFRCTTLLIASAAIIYICHLLSQLLWIATGPSATSLRLLIIIQFI